jgi:uncharacterized membrane protein YhaH (DUF805 family)
MDKYWNNYVGVVKKYAVFEGRASRREFWMFVLANLIIGVVANIVSPTLGMLYDLFVLIPSLALGARRLHDIGRSGWWLLIGLIPFIGAIILIIMFVQPSKRA